MMLAVEEVAVVVAVVVDEVMVVDVVGVEDIGVILPMMRIHLATVDSPLVVKEPLKMETLGRPQKGLVALLLVVVEVAEAVVVVDSVMVMLVRVNALVGRLNAIVELGAGEYIYF